MPTDLILCLVFSESSSFKLGSSQSHTASHDWLTSPWFFFSLIQFNSIPSPKCKEQKCHPTLNWCLEEKWGKKQVNSAGNIQRPRKWVGIIDYTEVFIPGVFWKLPPLLSIAYFENTRLLLLRHQAPFSQVHDYSQVPSSVKSSSGKKKSGSVTYWPSKPSPQCPQGIWCSSAKACTGTLQSQVALPRLNQKCMNGVKERRESTGSVSGSGR